MDRTLAHGIVRLDGGTGVTVLFDTCHKSNARVPRDSVMGWTRAGFASRFSIATMVSKHART